jgi:hypothetical protein
MASEKQIEANRLNAEKSTGPKTAEGKAVAAQNSLRHGLRTRQIVCFDEKRADFESFYAGLVETLAPADAIEEQLVERVALCAWRLRRAVRVEADLINSAHAAQTSYHHTQVATAFDGFSNKMPALSRYEMALDHAFKRALAQLERRQAKRHGEMVLPPLEVSIDGLDMLADDPGPNLEPENYQTNPIFPADASGEGEVRGLSTENHHGDTEEEE